MFCPECGTQNRHDVKFCIKCGYNFAEDVVLDSESKVKSALEDGTVLDKRYKLITIIEKGGMGAVYKALDLRLDNACAIKEMRENFERDEYRIYAIEKFKSEALILSKLKHPNIPRVFDYFIENDRYYLAMDFVEGQTLFKIMYTRPDKRLEEQELVSWTLQLCDVLSYLHSQDPPIIYRDIKPANIMINEYNRVILIDFGIARIFSPKSTGTMIGTQGYSPPEQYRGQVDPRSDIYALGATLHHLITGKDPQLDAPFSFPPVKELRSDVSDRIAEAIDRSLKFNMEDRFANINELRDFLEDRLPINMEVNTSSVSDSQDSDFSRKNAVSAQRGSGNLTSELESLLFSIESASSTITNRDEEITEKQEDKKTEPEKTEKVIEVKAEEIKPKSEKVPEPEKVPEKREIPRKSKTSDPITGPRKSMSKSIPQKETPPKPAQSQPDKKVPLTDLSLDGISETTPLRGFESLMGLKDEVRDSQLFKELLSDDTEEEKRIEKKITKEKNIIEKKINEKISEKRDSTVKTRAEYEKNRGELQKSKVVPKSGPIFPMARPTIPFGPIEIKPKLKNLPDLKKIAKKQDKQEKKEQSFTLSAISGGRDLESNEEILPVSGDPYGLSSVSGSPLSAGMSALSGSSRDISSGGASNASSFKGRTPEKSKPSNWYSHRANQYHTGENPKSGACKGNLKWRFHSNGRIYASPVIGGDGTIYFASNDGCLYAITAEGKEKWRYITDDSIYASPLVIEGYGIFFGSEDHIFYGIDFDGKEIWRFKAGDTFNSSASTNGKKIYVGNNDGNLYCIDLLGDEIWRFTIDNFIYSTPAIGPDGMIYIGSWDKSLHAITPEGKQKWKFETGDIIDSSPSVDGAGCVYFGSSDNFVYALDHIGMLKWRFKTNDKVSSSPAIHKERGIFVGSNDNTVYNINFEGNHRWHVRTNYSVKSSPAIDGKGNVYVGSDDFACYCFDYEGNMLWKFKTNGSVESSPCISDSGMVLFGSHDGWLYCLE